jgi:hypothetical protein
MARLDGSRIEFFDSSASFGVALVPPMKYAETADDLLKEMDFSGVEEALVWDAAMKDDSPVIGNRLLAKAIKGKPRLHGTWALLPFQTGEIGTPYEFLTAMKKNHIKALRAWPNEHRYLLNAVTFGDFFEIMVERNIPLLLDPDWPLITSVLRDAPNLTVIAVGHGSWGMDRYFRPLIESYPNFYIDTSRYELDMGIADFCARYGPDRLLFGTHYPSAVMGGPMLTLLHCDISMEAKQAIAAGNLRRLLGKVKL